MPTSFEKQAIIFIAASMLLSVAFLFHEPNGHSETVVTDPICSPEQYANDTSAIEGGFRSSSIEGEFQALKALIKSHTDSDEMEEYNGTLSLVIKAGPSGSVRVYPVGTIPLTPRQLQNKPCQTAPQGGGFDGLGGGGFY